MRPGERAAPAAKRPPRPITQAYLERAAIAHLERYSASADTLRRILRRKVERRCRLRGEGEEAGDFDLLVEETVARCTASGLVDDARYTQGKVAALRRRGGSGRAIAAKLAAKGVDRELVEETIAANETDDRAAALAFARRRRLGPWRSGLGPRGDRAANRDRDMASLARAGFGFGIAGAVVDGTGEDDVCEGDD